MVTRRRRSAKKSAREEKLEDMVTIKLQEQKIADLIEKNRRLSERDDEISQLYEELCEDYSDLESRAADVIQKNQELAHQLGNMSTVMEEVAGGKAALVRSPEGISFVRSDQLSAPRNLKAKDLRQSVIGLEDNLKRRIVGQDEAIHELVHHIRMMVTRETIDRPKVLKFHGPRGVGISYTAESLNRLLFDGIEQEEIPILKLDCSDYMDRYDYNSASTLQNALEDDVRTISSYQERYPGFGIIMLDQYMYANARLKNFLRTLFEMGETFKGSEHYNYSQKLFILLDRSKESREGIGFHPEKDKQENPSVLGHLSSTIRFRLLGKDDARSIFELEVSKVVRDFGVNVDFTKNAKDRIISKGFSEQYGVHGLQPAIEKAFDPVAEKVLNKKFSIDDMVVIGVKNGSYSYEYGKAPPQRIYPTEISSPINFMRLLDRNKEPVGFRCIASNEDDRILVSYTFRKDKEAVLTYRKGADTYQIQDKDGKPGTVVLNDKILKDEVLERFEPGAEYLLATFREKFGITQRLKELGR